MSINYITGLPTTSMLDLNAQHYVTGIQPPTLPHELARPAFPLPSMPDYHTGLPADSQLNVNYRAYVTGISPRIG
jgi:hypothetical protein